MRTSGILLPISALPARHGVGDFGEQAYHFIDTLEEIGKTIWQILPLNRLGYGESPYQTYSSFAGDEIYINLDLLKQEGLISEDISSFNENSAVVDYQAVRDFKEKYFKIAFENFKPTPSYQLFIEQEWVYLYAVFVTFKKLNNNKIWNQWLPEHRNWIKDKKYDVTIHQKEIEYEMFLQYMFYKQWDKLRQYANNKQIMMMGDLPIYTGLDSLDVWCNQEVYLLDENGDPTFVAGVAPDYFSETGQRWGNPLYDWDYLAKHDFDFWINRLAYTEKMFDIIRIDHFRAFDTYYKIPASCPTAIEGEWIEAPGYALFDMIQQKLPNLKIIAEDLGDLRPEVLALRDHYKLKGMKIVQHMLDFEKEAMLNESRNMVIYTGTHDNQTIQGWLNILDETYLSQIKNFFKEKNYNNNELWQNFVEYTYHTLPDIAIIPVQDLLGLDDETRFNMPGVLNETNWRWKLVNFDELTKHIANIKKWLKESKRL